MEIIFTFETTNYAIKAESIFMQNGVDVRVMPLPAAIRAGCGLCLRVAPVDVDRAKALLAKNDVPVQALYEKDNGKYQPYKNGE